ncbi:Histidinol dehydrogenase [Pseudomonas tremae]|uniref:Histidinol dehydrogenase n=2 Tax=Pseudomonas syringae group TaxID=136849 RepID=A0AA40TU55_9PSED|nr:MULTISPECIES: histidinol dehydrogenase [Pseudomonas syringae group]KOP56383.1 histidinol dehydrogenase [Pseudomonas coronafaciens pv. porri]KOP57793.1 histidinol dehydrogenase [Pseudomonas coronafaciens pv. porri]KPY20435.1 Histidinol dehydrogenase [Pseudomonas coronafaciens pv. porri]KPY96554.1 Histidinol dehydrogenase [Pseudomonas tremae]RMO04006.1 Histidinol dehydrogenase [Pseudomonas coronafaciens pv. zizaniae]
MTTPTAIRRLDAADPDFARHLDHLLSWESVSDDSVNQRVLDIIKAVRERGDAALVEFTQKFDGLQVASMADLILPRERLELALTRITPVQREALEKAAERVRSYHEKQKQDSWSYTEADGTVLGQKVTPLDRAGLYVPGGKASYPSSVLMNAIPAKVAGVTEVVMVVPTPRGEINELVLAAACIAGVDRVFTIGGAQAVAALAYGTESVPKVDKVVGPGNIYVATAKRHVFGQVGIDMIAGPSEILVVCDGQTDPDWIAMDLFSQAEHDEDAQAILVSPDAEFLDKVAVSITRLLPTMDRAAIVETSINGRGALIKVADMAQAIEVANRIAPEHLELSVADPEAWLPHIRHAGAIFMGRHTSEALGDYCAGPNHVLPTSGTARFSSPLGVYDFQKRSSIIYCSPQGASELGKTASVLARGESLSGHARSAEYRITDPDWKAGNIEDGK